MNIEQMSRAMEIRNEMARIHEDMPTFLEGERYFTVRRERAGDEAFDLLRAEYAKVLKERHAVLVKEFEAL